jgi:hypothetical protein
MKAAEFWTDRIKKAVTEQNEPGLLEVIRAVQVDTLKASAQFAFEEREHFMAIRLGQAAAALEAQGGQPTPVKA